MNATSYRSKTNQQVLSIAPIIKIRNIFSSHAEAMANPETDLQPRI
jgi:hypothetical protein